MNDSRQFPPTINKIDSAVSGVYGRVLIMNNKNFFSKLIK